MLTHARPHIARRVEAEFSFNGTPGQTRLRAAAAAAALAVGARAGVSTSSSVGGDQSHAWPGTAHKCGPVLGVVFLSTRTVDHANINRSKEKEFHPSQRGTAGVPYLVKSHPASG